MASKKVGSGEGKRAAGVRLSLGLAQMTAAAFAIGLLVNAGVTRLALAAAVVACTLTTISVLLFGGHRRRR